MSTDIEAKYHILREFLKEQEWSDISETDNICPWCGVPESHGVHNFPCHWDNINKITQIETGGRE